MDFFLLVLHSIGVLILVLIAPFMVSVCVNRDFAKRFTYAFFWTVVTLCVIFPALAQAARYFAYLSANMALGTSATPNFTFDPATNSIIANGDPTPIILNGMSTKMDKSSNGNSALQPTGIWGPASISMLTRL